MGKGKKKDLKDVCLHCLFLDAHKNKWPKWTPSGDDNSNEAFQDLVQSAIKITVNVFMFLDEANQMKFMRSVMDKSKELDEGRNMLSKILDQLKPRGPTQH